MKIELGPLHPSFGAEVVGVNLARHLDEETIAAIENEWTRYSLLLFNVRAPLTPTLIGEPLARWMVRQ
jgi:alpha-ketoglutarate-dependent taurine dioxygenase